MPLNFIDIAVVCLLFYGLIRGAFRGFFVEIASLLALVLGVFGALHFSSFTASLLSNYLAWEYLPLLAFALTFVGIIIGVSWVGKLLTKLAKVILLGIDLDFGSSQHFFSVSPRRPYQRIVVF
jgi:membrane protein required for colicin V production